MTWETFPCCCQAQPCVCAGVYSSIVVKWTGSVTFVPLDCREYWRRWANDPATGCGQSARLTLQSSTVFSIPSVVVPGLNPSTCSSFACVDRTLPMNRFYQSFEPPFGSPEYYDPVYRCQFDQLDSVFGPYSMRMRHSVFVTGPRSSTSDPFWRVRISIGSIRLGFRSISPDYSCRPDGFELDPDAPLPDTQSCQGPCSSVSTICLPSCEILNPPPFPFSYPGAGGQPGSTLSHGFTIDPGSVRIG